MPPAVGPRKLDLRQAPHVHDPRVGRGETGEIDPDDLHDLDDDPYLAPPRPPWLRAVAVLAAAALVIPLVVAAVDAVAS